MFRYFWLEGEDVPTGVGFGLFTWQHFAAVLVCAVGVFCLCAVFLRKSARTQAKILKITAILLLIGNLARDLFLSIIGHMSLDYLPLHLCSFAIFVYLVHAFLPETYSSADAPETTTTSCLRHTESSTHIDKFRAAEPSNDRTKSSGTPSESFYGNSPCSTSIFCEDRQKRVYVYSSPFRSALAEIGLVLLMPGTGCALIFPDWSWYPMWNFMSLHSFLWHAVLIAYPLMCLLSGRVQPRISHIWMPILYLAILVPPTYLFDVLTGCNYLFLLRPVPGTPLQWLSDSLGPYWLIGYAILAFAVILAIYFVIELIRHIVMTKIHHPR